MAKLSTQEIIDAIKEMKILEVKELVDAMKEEFGVDPSAVAVAAAPAVAAVAAVVASAVHKRAVPPAAKGAALPNDTIDTAVATTVTMAAPTIPHIKSGLSVVSVALAILFNSSPVGIIASDIPKCSPNSLTNHSLASSLLAVSLPGFIA